MELEAGTVKKGHDKSLGGDWNALYLDMVMVSLMYKTGKTHRNVLLSEYSLFHTNYFSIKCLRKNNESSCIFRFKELCLELWLRYVFFWIDDFKKDLFGPSQRILTRKQLLYVCWLLLDSGSFHTLPPPISFCSSFIF